MKPLIACLLACGLPLAATATFEAGVQFGTFALSDYGRADRDFSIGLPSTNVFYAKWFPSEHAALGPFALFSVTWDNTSSPDSWLAWVGTMTTYYPTGHNRDGYFVEGKLGIFDASWGEEIRETAAGLGAGYQWMKDRPFVWQIKVEYERTIPSRQNTIGVSFVLARRVGKSQ